MWREDEELDDSEDISHGDLEETIIQHTVRYWIEKTIVHDRPDRQEGPNRVGASLWSPQKSNDGRDIYANMRAVSPGDIVFHLTDNLGFTGISNVESKVDDAFTGIPGTAWGGQPGYRVAL